MIEIKIDPYVLITNKMKEWMQEKFDTHIIITYLFISDSTLNSMFINKHELKIIDVDIDITYGGAMKWMCHAYCNASNALSSYQYRIYSYV